MGRWYVSHPVAHRLIPANRVFPGDLVDWWCTWRTKRNDGIYEPESRLYMLAIPFFITASGCILFGYGVQNEMSWVALFFGYGMISVALTAVSGLVNLLYWRKLTLSKTPTITMAYVSDCLLPVNSDALLLVNGRFLLNMRALAK